MLTLTEGGSWASSLGISALTAAATSTVLVPGWRWIARVIERAPLYHDATRLFCTSSSTTSTRVSSRVPLQSVHDVKGTLLLTLVLVVLVIFLFLRNVSATVIPSLALPMSLVGTFGVMW